MEALDASGETDSIDVRRTPLTPQEYQVLKDTLGQGEVEARIQALGETHVRETTMAGVWWVTHYNAAGQVLGEFIEVTPVPEIMRSDPSAMPLALAGLRGRIAGLEPGVAAGRGQEPHSDS